jgi:hypothetical protein
MLPSSLGGRKNKNLAPGPKQPVARAGTIWYSRARVNP